MNIIVLLCTVATLARGYTFTDLAPVSPWVYSGLVSPNYQTFHEPLVKMAGPLGLSMQYHTQLVTGQSSYGHILPHQSHTAIQDETGNKVGSFSYVKPDGSIARTDYVADSWGYRVASNDLPIAPLVHPQPVADTPEVQAAKATHLAEVERIRNRARREVILPASTSPLFHHIVPASVHTPIIHDSIIHTPVTYSHPLSHHLITPTKYIVKRGIGAAFGGKPKPLTPTSDNTRYPELTSNPETHLYTNPKLGQEYASHYHQ